MWKDAQVPFRKDCRKSTTWVCTIAKSGRKCSCALRAGLMLIASGCGSSIPTTPPPPPGDAGMPTFDVAVPSGDVSKEDAPEADQWLDAAVAPGVETGNGDSSESSDVRDGVANADSSSEPAVCLRLNTPTDRDRELVLSRVVAENYLLEIFSRCELRGLIQTSHDEAIDWRNRQIEWNRTLWGCLAGPVRGFELVNREVASVSAKNAERLIAIYMEVATTALELNAKEWAAMRAQLTQQALPVVDAAADDDAFSRCATDATADEANVADSSGAADASIDSNEGPR
jgi:hypothetical protein